MTTITGHNYARQLGISFRNTQFVDCNFSQQTAETVLDVVGCTFIKCNLVNCSIPEDNIIEDCNVAQIDFEAE